jgi:hypothetical protein
MIFVNILNNIIYLQPMDNPDEVNTSQNMYENISHHFYCAITGKLMVDPVLTPNGDTYERAAIEEWLKKKGTCPVTRNPLTIASLIPNKAMKSLIQTKNAKELKAQIEEDERVAAAAKPKPLPTVNTTTWIPIRQTTSSFANVREVALFDTSQSYSPPEENHLHPELIVLAAETRARQQQNETSTLTNALSTIVTNIIRNVNNANRTVYIENEQDWPNTMPKFSS